MGEIVEAPRQPEDLTQPLIDIAVESWKFARIFLRVVSKLDAGEGSRFLSQHRYYMRRLEETLLVAGLRLVNVEGHAFDPGVPATPLNMGDFSPDDQLVVDQMVEPILMGPNSVVRSGTVMVRKAKQ